jgi:hypothetical protein
VLTSDTFDYSVSAAGGELSTKSGAILETQEISVAVTKPKGKPLLQIFSLLTIHLEDFGSVEFSTIRIDGLPSSQPTSICLAALALSEEEPIIDNGSMGSKGCELDNTSICQDLVASCQHWQKNSAGKLVSQAKSPYHHDTMTRYD